MYCSLFLNGNTIGDNFSFVASSGKYKEPLLVTTVILLKGLNGDLAAFISFSGNLKGKLVAVPDEYFFSDVFCCSALKYGFGVASEYADVAVVMDADVIWIAIFFGG